MLAYAMAAGWFLAVMASMGETAAIPEAAVAKWNCRNQVEIWCAADGCAAAADFTPMDVTASTTGRVSACAYSGCWEGDARREENAQAHVWTADRLNWTGVPAGGYVDDVALLIMKRDGVGFIRIGGFANPLICERRPMNELQESETDRQSVN